MGFPLLNGKKNTIRIFRSISHLSTTNEWVDVFLLLIASQQYKTDDGFLEDISTKILDNTVTKLTNTSRLIIWERIITGDILFEGKGYQTSDDLFQVSGRANFLLRNLTGKDFGYVSMKSAKKELKLLQSNWTKFLKKEIVAEYIDPYEYSNKALKEIRSKVALQALIYSLKPSAEKEALTKKCIPTG
ncbi:hypothetical protein EON80_16570 [bacterium]|nr:MAG: hypothetical protein EON80_16570 [bacterium]